MDIRCVKCGEPWDMDCIHEEVDSRWPDKPWNRKGKHNQDDYEKHYYAVVRREFQQEGCKALGGRCSENKAHEGIAAVYEMLGDDLDGAACMLEDAEYLGMFDEE